MIIPFPRKRSDSAVVLDGGTPLNAAVHLDNAPLSWARLDGAALYYVELTKLAIKAERARTIVEASRALHMSCWALFVVAVVCTFIGTQPGGAALILIALFALSMLGILLGRYYEIADDARSAEVWLQFFEMYNGDPYTLLYWSWNGRHP